MRLAPRRVKQQVDLYVQGFVLYWVFTPAANWPELLAVRILLVAVPLLLWIVLHLMVWYHMSAVLQSFR